MDSFPRDPSAVLDYLWDWAAWLAAGETITAHAITAPAGITINSSTHTTTTVTAWLAGGTLNATYTVTCHITTTAGREDSRSIIVRTEAR